MTLSQDLFALAGLFQKYTRTGGTFTPIDATLLTAKLMMLAEGVQSQAAALKSISEEFDRYVEDQVNDRPGPFSGAAPALRLIEGGAT